MSITGTVKLAVVVAPNGTVKSAKPVGGHPLLVNAAMDAMKQWRFEAAPRKAAAWWSSNFSLENRSNGSGSHRGHKRAVEEDGGIA